MLFRKRSTTVSTCNSNFLDIMRTPYPQLFTFPRSFRDQHNLFSVPVARKELLNECITILYYGGI